MPFKPDHPVCWTEIPVRDLDAARTFYETVFHWEMQRDEEGPQPILFFPTADPAKGVAGHLYEGKPSREGSTIHLVVPDTLAKAKERCWEAGGTVLDQDIPIPAGTFCYATDPDGNSIGLFEPKAA
ncbi:VOC family protein [Aestuariibius sp. 2305UL40-4]|uniref:VOC family protein n=1 Tax=Aestuariibius violaceus TaxID=3234132 RepID=UPI00345E523D